jgi:hypothetical protein
MKRFSLSLAVLAALTASASAQTYGGAPSCAKEFKEFWDNNSPLAKSLTPEQFAQLSRTALRGYDACSAGDERFSTDFFKQLGSALAKPEDVFNQINSSPLAKKK